MYYYIHVLLCLAILWTCKGQDVVLTSTSPCYNINDSMTLEAEYKGLSTVDGVMWTITGGASSMTIDVPKCIFRFAIPIGFPLGRMSLDCSSAPKYRLTVNTLENEDMNKTWGVAISLSNGTTSSGIQQQTITQCASVKESNTGFPRWAMVLIIVVVGVVAAIICSCVYRHKKKTV